MAKPTKDKPFVAVIWRDAEDGPTWASVDEVHKFAEQECLVKSVGWLIRRTKKFLVLAADKTLSGNNPGELGRVTKIPAKMVTSVIEVSEPSNETNPPLPLDGPEPPDPR